MKQTEIRIENARSHNLKGVSCRIPLRSLTVVTGVSGSGKSTLAFDTLYAEGQRRYVSSLSTYARQFLERLPRPEVDSISNLPPAIAIEQRNAVASARSTVGTATEILDHLRLLFAKVGRTVCPDCDLPVVARSASDVAAQLLESFPGERLSLAAPLAWDESESAADVRGRLLRDGYSRLLDANLHLIDVGDQDDSALERQRGSALLLIDRVAIPPRASGEEAAARVAESVAAAFGCGAGELVVVPADAAADALLPRYREGFRCDGCGRSFQAPVPALLSFNSPLGACGHCQGFGKTAEIDLERVVPDASRSIAEVAIAPFRTPMGKHLQQDLLEACAGVALPTDVAFRDLSEAQREWVFDGDESNGGAWYGVRGFFAWLGERRYKVQARALIARYRRFEPCERCRGTRLVQEALQVRIGGRHIGDVQRDSVEELLGWLEALRLSENEQARVGRLLEALQARVATVARVGLGYVTLDRQVRTLSGGEAQRIQLATALGGRLTSSLYVLDEPSIGLHAADVERLIAVLHSIRDYGNTVVVVEHAPEIITSADHVIDLGPAAGRLGGRVIAEGSVDEVRRCPDSQTGRALRGELTPRRRTRKRAARGCLRIVGAREHNLDDLTVELPLGQLVVVTGVSGAGKSTLVDRVLVGQLLASGHRGAARNTERPGACDRIEGAEALSSVVVVDQSPASRNPRSNPATVSKAFDAIRSRFAATREARALGVAPGWFSFNVAGGRCESCEGAGEVQIDMQFLDDVRVPCEACGGSRYGRDVMRIRLDGRSITDVLALTIDEACEIFHGDRKVAGRLEPFVQVGLGYLQLGQPLSTLSGGENQRVSLAQALARAPASGSASQRDFETTLFVLDEPTTGLHPADIQILLDNLDRLIDAGASAVVVEHNLDVIRRADFLLDLGPQGGPGGGRIVASGTPEAVAGVAESRTGAALRLHGRASSDEAAGS